MKSEKRAIVVHVSEVLATGILEFIYSLVTEIKDYDHVIIYRIRELGHDDISVRKLFPPNVMLVKWENVDRPIHLIKDTKAAIELYKHLKSINPNVIHLHSSKAGILGRIIAPLFLNRNAVIYTPNGAPFARTDITSGKQKLFKFCERFANFCSGQVVCVSNSESNIYRSINIQSTFVNNGVVLPQKNLVFNKDHRNSKLKIVSSGRITNQKDPIAFNKIAQHYVENRNVEFIWIGDGNRRKDLCSPNISITGWINKKQVLEHLSNSSLYLSTALWEGLPFSVLEAMSFGMPVVISNCIGNEDLIEHGKSGFIYEKINDSIKHIDKFINQPKLISKMGKNTWIRCMENFSRESMTKKYQNVYDEILDKYVVLNPLKSRSSYL